VNDTVKLEANIGKWSGALRGDLAGGYRGRLTYKLKESPLLDVIVAGQEVITDYRLPSIHRFFWIDRIVNFKPGIVASGIVLKRKDPEVVLGDLLKHGPDDILFLGMGGELTVGFKKPRSGIREVAIFVKPDEPLRPYKVEVPVRSGRTVRWIEIGRSQGVTQTFLLRGKELSGRIGTVPAVRIVDLSRSTLCRDGSPSMTPGIGIGGVGVRVGR
jgi:hypothetical protein